MKKKNLEKMNVDGMMSYGKQEDGRMTADFQNYDTETCVEEFDGKCHVQRMRDGNLYMTELPKKQHKKGKGEKIYRGADSTLSLGQNHVVYFSFWMDEELIDLAPDALIHQAINAAGELRKIIERRDFFDSLG